MNRAWRTAILVQLLFTVVATDAYPREPIDKQRCSVVIDVGHSKEAGGATSARGRHEFEFNLKLANTINKALVKKGYTEVRTLVSKGKGDLPSLLERVAAASALEPSLFISVHHDSVQSIYLKHWTHQGKRRPYSDVFAGYSIFASRRGAVPDRSLRFATLLSDRLLEQQLTFSLHHAKPIDGENRPLADAQRGIYWFDDLVVLRGQKTPAVLLEAGVIVNRREETLLAGAQRQSAIASAVAEAFGSFCEEQASRREP